MTKNRIRRHQLPAVVIMALLLGGCLAKTEVPAVDSDAPVSGNNSAPLISGNPSHGVTVGHIYTFIPSASDPDGDTLTFSVENLPSWATFDATTGEVSGQPSLNDALTHSGVTISVSDGHLTSRLASFDITVTQSSLGSATLTLIAPSLNTDGTPFMDLAAFNIYFGMSEGNYPNQIHVGNPGISTFVAENLAPSTYFFVATAINESGVESAFSNEVTRVVN